MVFHWSLSDSKSPQVSRTFLGILADCSSAVVWMVSILPLISRSSSLFSKFIGTVPCAPTAIGITFTLIFHSFFNSLARFRYLSIISCYRDILCMLIACLYGQIAFIQLCFCLCNAQLDCFQQYMLKYTKNCLP